MYGNPNSDGDADTDSDADKECCVLDIERGSEPNITSYVWLTDDTWNQDANGLDIQLPSSAPGEHAFAFKMTFSGDIPPSISNSVGPIVRFRR